LIGMSSDMQSAVEQINTPPFSPTSDIAHSSSHERRRYSRALQLNPAVNSCVQNRGRRTQCMSKQNK
jgi:hypothetical protein